MKKGCLEDLLRVRELDSPDEVGAFDGVLEVLGSEVLSKGDLNEGRFRVCEMGR